VPVLIQITNLYEDGYSYFMLDDEKYSLFPYEQEVLLNTGSRFNIIEISEVDNDFYIEYYLITLKLVNDFDFFPDEIININSSD
jgi:hypothetical protein